MSGFTGVEPDGHLLGLPNETRLLTIDSELTELTITFDRYCCVCIQAHYTPIQIALTRTEVKNSSDCPVLKVEQCGTVGGTSPIAQ